MRTTLLTLAAVLLAAPVSAYDVADYCRDTMAADRLSCHAQHLSDLADCRAFTAFMRWIGSDLADRDAAECRADADEACQQCKAEVACPEGAAQ